MTTITEKNFNMKNNKHKRRSNPENKPFTHSHDTDLDYENPNNSFYRRDFFYNKHRNNSYISNSFVENSQNFGTRSYKRKRRKSYTFGESASTRFTNYKQDYGKPNNNFSKYRNNSHMSNSNVENSQSFAANSYGKKSKKRRRKTYTFGDSVSNNSFRNHKQNSSNKKRKNSEQSNDFYVNKKPKHDNYTESLANSDTYKSSEDDQLNISSDKPDSEIFFFDISGNRYNSYEEAFSASLKERLVDKDGNESRKSNKNISINFKGNIEASKKLRKNVDAVTDITDSKIIFKNLNVVTNVRKPKEEIGLSVTDSLEIPGKLKKKKVKSTENQIKNKIVQCTNKEKNPNENDEFQNKVKNIFNQDEITHQEATLGKTKNRKKSNGTVVHDATDGNYAIDIEEADLEDKDAEGSFKKPKKSKKTMVDARASDCEVSVDDVSFHKKKKKKKKTNDTSTPLGDILNQEVTSKEENDTIFNTSFKKAKKAKKHRDIETFVDIRDSDCEITVNDVSSRKKKKERRKLIANEIPQVDPSEKKNGDSFYGHIVHDDIKETNEPTTYFTSSKISKKKNSPLVDLRDSDCEMNFTGISDHTEMKNDKSQLQNIKSDIEHDGNRATTKRLNNNVTSTLVSPKKLKERKIVESLVDVGYSDCETSFNTSNQEKNKKKKKLTQDEVSIIEESKYRKKNGDFSYNDIEYDDVGGTNKQISPFKLPKKSEDKRNTIVDIRDSDCEMSFTGISCRTEKKKKKKHLQNISSDVKHDNNQTTTKNDDLISTLASLQKLKEHKITESVVDIGYSDCEMSFNISNRKKKKKEKKLTEDEVSRIEESTSREESRDLFNSDIEYDNVRDTDSHFGSFKSPKKSKDKKNTLVDIRDSDCEMSFTDISHCSQKKKKKRHLQNINSDIEHDSNQTITKRLNDDATSTLASPKKLKEHKITESLVNNGYGECEMSINISDRRKKKKKKKLMEDEVSRLEENTSREENGDLFNNDIEYDNVRDINRHLSSFKLSKKLKNKKNILVDIRDSDCEMSFSDISCRKKKKHKHRDSNNEIEPNSENIIKELISPAQLKKHDDLENLIDIRDSDCEMTVNNGLKRKKKKKKKSHIEEEAPIIGKSTLQEENGDNFSNDYEDVGEIKPSSFKPSKKSKEANNSFINYDCDVSFVDISHHKKKEKKHRENINYNIEHNNTENYNREMNVDEVLNRKKNKKKKISIEVEDSEIEGTLQKDSLHNTGDAEKTNKDANSLLIPKKFEKSITSVDLRDSECERSVSDVSCNKRKKKKKHREIVNNDTEHHGDERETKEQDNDVTINSVSPIKLKKPKDIDDLVDIRNGYREMSVNDVLNHKKEKTTMKTEGPEIEEYTPQKKNVDNLNNRIEYDNVKELYKEPRSSKAPKKSKLKNSGFETFVESSRSSDCEASFDDISCRKKKNKKYKENADNEVEQIIHGNRIGKIGIKPDDSFKESKNLKVDSDVTDQGCEFMNNMPGTSKVRNSLENLDNYKQGTNISIDLDITENKADADVKCKNKKPGSIYSRIYSSSSEGYQSDSSEIMSPIKCNKISSVGDMDQSDCTNKSYKLNSDLNFEICKVKMEKGHERNEYVSDVPHMNDSKKDVKSTENNNGEKDDSSGTSNYKSIKSTFVKEFENRNRLNETETSTEASDVLEIPEIKEEPLEDDIDTVLDLNIVCTFSLCALHSILTRSTIPRKDEMEKIKELNLEVKHGSFSKEEDKMILNNWKTFCEEYKLTVNPSLFLTFPRKMRMSNKTNFLRYLAHGLNNRMLHSVHARFKNLLSGPRIKSGRFTEEEDRTIMNYMGRMETKTPFCDLAKLLNRNKVAIVKRYSLLKNDGNHQTVVRWTPEMVDVFVSRMKEVTKCDKLKQLKHRKLTEMEWKKLSKKMDNIPYSKLQRAWHHTIYPRLFAKDVDRNILKLIKVDIIHNLRERGVTDWKLVNWKEIADDYDGFTPEKIYMMFKKTVCYHVPEAKQANLKDCLDFLENVLKHGQISTAHKFQKFAYKDGHIVAKYD